MSKTHPLRTLFLCLSALLISTLACTFSPCKAIFDIPQNLFSSAEEMDLEAALKADTVDHRPRVLETLGPPDAFDISILEVEGGQIRKESWRYYQYGTRVDFVDGEAVWTVAIEPVPEGTIFAAWYDPLDFKTGMTGDEIIRLIASTSPAGAEPEWIDLSQGGEDLAGGATLIGDQIIVGLYEERLVYVETIALMPQGGEQ